MNIWLEILPTISTILFGILVSILLYENKVLKEIISKQDSNVIEMNRKLKQALHNAIKECCYGVRGSDACNDLDTLYKAFEKKVWENVK